MGRYFELTSSEIVEESKIEDMYFILYGTYPDPETQQLESFIKDCKGICSEFTPTVKFLAEHGYKVKAIKLFHDTVGCSLAEARDFVEANFKEV